MAFKINRHVEAPPTYTGAIERFPNGIYECTTFPGQLLTVSNGPNDVALLWDKDQIGTYPQAIEHTAYLWTKLPPATVVEINLKFEV